MNQPASQPANQPAEQGARSSHNRKRVWALAALLSIICLALLTVLYVLWFRSPDDVEDSGEVDDEPPQTTSARREPMPSELADGPPPREPVSDTDVSDDRASESSPLEVVELRSGRVWVPWPSALVAEQPWASAVPPYTAEATTAFETRRRVAKERPDAWGTFEPIVDTGSLAVDYELNDERTDVAERIRLCAPALSTLGTPSPSRLTLSDSDATEPAAAATFAVAQHLVRRAVLSRGPQSLAQACVDAALASGARQSPLIDEVELLWARGIRLEETAPAPAGAWVLWSQGDTTQLVVCHQPDTIYVADASTRERLMLFAQLPERAEAIEVHRRDGIFTIGEARLFASECAQGSSQPDGTAVRGAGYDRAADWLRERREQTQTSQVSAAWIDVDELDAWRTVVAARARIAGSVG